MRVQKKAAMFLWLAVSLAGCVSTATLDKVIAAIPPPPPAVKSEAPKPIKRATIAFEVTDHCSDAPLADVFARFIDNSQKQTDQRGYVAFEKDAGVDDQPIVYAVTFLLTDDYEIQTREFALVENRQFPVRLKRREGCPAPIPVVATSAPVPVAQPVASVPATPPAPLPSPVFFTECGPRANPTANRRSCLDQVAAVSTNWTKCKAGHDEVACHRFTLEVVTALAAGDPRWGVITKRRGESACDFDRCGSDLDNGHGEDVVAYLPDGAPLNQWLGADIVGCFGCPTPTDPNVPSYHWPSEFHPEQNRAQNLWSKVPARK